MFSFPELARYLVDPLLLLLLLVEALVFNSYSGEGKGSQASYRSIFCQSIVRSGMGSLSPLSHCLENQYGDIILNQQVMDIMK